MNPSRLRFACFARESTRAGLFQRLRNGRRLLRLGARIDHDIDEVIHVILAETYKKWRRQLRGAKVFWPLGRPGTPSTTRLLVLRMAKDNLQWGYRRVVGWDNTVLEEHFVPKSEGAVRCKSELGGSLKSYYRLAA